MAKVKQKKVVELFGRFYNKQLLEQQTSLDMFAEPKEMIEAVLNKHNTYNGYHFKTIEE